MSWPTDSSPFYCTHLLAYVGSTDGVPMIPTCALVINAGGQSRRMGTNKALLPVPTSGLPLLGHIIQRLQGLPIDQLIIVANQLDLNQTPWLPADLPITLLPDAYAAAGALGGIATGLQACPAWAICVACDLPLVKPGVLQFLCELAGEQAVDGRRWDAIVPQVGGYAQPLHALYHRDVLPAIEKRLAAGELRAAGFLGDVSVRWVAEAELLALDPDLTSFFNANTPAEWAEAMRALQTEAS